jgi:hypothetical protein
MRISISLCLIALAGCNAPPRVDPTPNQMLAAEDANYPAGPYGYWQGSTIQDIVFLGKHFDSSANYTQIPMQRISLGDFHNDTTVKFLVLSGVAGWCPPCNNEQMSVPTIQAKYQPMGYRFFEAMIEGYKRGQPATENDVNTWQNAHTLSVDIGVDPEDKIHEYADLSAFPLNMAIRTSDMKIVYMGVGELQEAEYDSVLSSLK